MFIISKGLLIIQTQNIGRLATGTFLIIFKTIIHTTIRIELLLTCIRLTASAPAPPTPWSRSSPAIGQESMYGCSLPGWFHPQLGSQRRSKYRTLQRKFWMSSFFQHLNMKLFTFTSSGLSCLFTQIWQNKSALGWAWLSDPGMVIIANTLTEGPTYHPPSPPTRVNFLTMLHISHQNINKTSQQTYCLQKHCTGMQSLIFQLQPPPAPPSRAHAAQSCCPSQWTPPVASRGCCVGLRKYWEELHKFFYCP